MTERFSPRARVERMVDEMDRLVSEATRRARLLPRLIGPHPDIDMYETPDQLVVKMAIPGAQPSDIDVSLEKSTLTVRGRYGDVISEHDRETVTWHFQEIATGDFVATIPLPIPVDPESVTATCDRGMLELTMLKSAETRAKHIPIRPPS